MGTFDQLNLRINGYDFHVSLMAGKEDWSGDKVKKVFDTWKGLLPIHQTDSLGRTWQEAAQALQQKKAGMYLLGAFVAQQFTKGAEQDDLDFFTFPEVDSTIGADAIDAPDRRIHDGQAAEERGRREEAARRTSARPTPQNIAVKADPSVIAPTTRRDTVGVHRLQKKSAEFVKSAKSIAQFLDRDTRPDFASTVMIPALQSFIKTPDDIDGLVKNIEQQKKSIFTELTDDHHERADRRAAPADDRAAVSAAATGGSTSWAALDRLVIILMVVVPTLLLIWLVWFPASAR